MPYSRIVVPLDGSELAKQALPKAEELARLTGAPLHLVQVLDITGLERYGPYAVTTATTAYQDLLHDEASAANEYLDGVEHDLTERGLQVTAEVRRGAVSRELLDAAKPGDLYVMSSHGRSGPARWFLGSVAEDLIRRSSVPVLLVPNPDRAHE